MKEKTDVTKGIIQTFQREFPDLKISEGFAKEIESYMSKEPKEGYGLHDCYEMVNKMSHIRKVDVKDVARELFYILLGQYLMVKYGPPEHK